MTRIKLWMSVAAGLVLPLHGEEIPQVLPIGGALPGFTLPGADGKSYTVGSFEAAKVLCLIFTSNHCPDSVAAATRMEALYQDYKGKGVAVVAVNGNNPDALTPDELGYSPFGDSHEEMGPFAADYGWTFPYLYDGETQALTVACGAQSTPHAFVFDAERKLRYTGRLDDGGRKGGPVEKSQIREALDAVLAGAEVKEPVTRSFGCSTKWLFKKPRVVADEEQWKKKPVRVDDLDAGLARKLRENGTDKLRLINFWSTSCGPCVKEFPDLVDTYRRFQNRQVELITISLDAADSRVAVEGFLKSQHAALSDKTVPSLEKEGRTSNNYHWTGGNPDELAKAIDEKWTGALPYTLLIAPGGEILWRHNDEVEPVELRRQVLKGLK